MKLVLFDIDGTLLSDRGASRGSFAHALSAVYGYDGDLAQYDFSGRTDPQIAHMVLGDAGHDAAAINAEIITRTLAGQGNAGATAAVVMNAAAALYVAGVASTYEDGVRLAREGISSKAGLQALDRMRAAYAA